MADLDYQRRMAIELLYVAGHENAGSALSRVSRIDRAGWTREWHNAIESCIADLVGGDEQLSESEGVVLNALTLLRRSMFEDHEEARRCASR